MKYLRTLALLVTLSLADALRADQASAWYVISDATTQAEQADNLETLAQAGIDSVSAYRLDVVGWRATAQLTQYQVWDYNNSLGAADSNAAAASTKLEEGRVRLASGDEWLEDAVVAYGQSDWTTAEGFAEVAEYDFGQAALKFQESLEASEAAWEFLVICEGIVHPNP